MKLTLSLALVLCSFILQGALTDDKYGCGAGYEPIFDNVNYKFEKCQICPVGTYQASGCFGDNENCCEYCMGNDYSDVQGATQCKTCTPGSIANKDRNECTQCPAGTFQTITRTYGFASCEACPFATDSNAGSTQCSNGEVLNWFTGYGYTGLEDGDKAKAQQTIKKTLADPALLASNVDIFLYSAINAIFNERIENLVTFGNAPEGSAEMLQAWGEIDWIVNLDLTNLKDALQATGQLLVNAYNAPDALPRVKSLNMDEVVSFVEKVNPAATLQYMQGYTGDFISYQEGGNFDSIELEVTNIENGFVNNDFRQIGEAFGLVIRTVMGL